MVYQRRPVSSISNLPGSGNSVSSTLGRNPQDKLEKRACNPSLSKGIYTAC